MKRPIVFFGFSLIGIIFAAYSIASEMYFLAVISFLFTVVSAYNIFCGMKKRHAKR